MPCRLQVRLAGGEDLIGECLYPPGHSFADSGLDRAVVEAKFHEVAGAVLSNADRARVIEEIAALDCRTSLRPLMSILVNARAAH